MKQRNNSVDIQLTAIVIQPQKQNRVLAILAAFLLVCTAFLVRVEAAAGDLDPAFGAGGIATTNILGGLDGASAIAIQPDGKIVVAGTAGNFAIIGDNFAVVRYHSDGTLDAAFGTGGIVTTGFFNKSLEIGLAIQPDGKIIVVGTVLGPGSEDFGIARYNPDGSLDALFGIGGKVTTDFFGDFDGANAVVIQPDGKILVSGIIKQIGLPSDFGLARYETNGDLDLTFGSGGFVTTDIDEVDLAKDLALQPDGKIVVAGNANVSDFAAVRFDENGDLDPTFGTGGKVQFDFGGIDNCNALAIQTDGKIVLAGSVRTVGTPSDFALARLEANGDFDMTFGTGGKVTTDFLGFGDTINDVAIQPDGKIVAAGLVTIWENQSTGDIDFGMARYDTNGILDAGFGTGGKVTTPITDSEAAQGVAIQEDCKIVAAGFSNPFNTSDSLFGVVRYDGGTCGQQPPCPKSQGFWKNNPTLWPVDSLTLGSKVYTKTELLKILNEPTATDASIILARQLIAAKLNLENGSLPDPVSAAIVQADNLLSSYNGKLGYKVKSSSAAGQMMTAEAAILDAYNQGLLTPVCTQ